MAPSGDAYVAGRDVHVHLQPGAPTGAAVRFLGRASDIDPFDLDVHPAEWTGKPGRHEPALTPYLGRDHDQALRGAIRQAIDRKRSLFVFLEGDSTVGKTRALYEAIRTVTPDWPVAFPMEDEELLRWLDAGAITSGTVLWLNESQTYFDGKVVGPKVAARLDALLRSVPGIVAVGTLWRHPFLEKYLKQDTETDTYAPVRRLLNRAARIAVPDHLTAQERQAWAELPGRAATNSDQRLTAALYAARDDGKVIQHLTGGPELLDCFRSETGFTPVELALLTTMLDARRLGHRSPVPITVIEKACDGYLGPHQRPGAPDWARTALTALTTGMRTDGGNAGPGKMLTALIAVRTASGQEPIGYLPDDYLDQNSYEERDGKPVPIELWNALAERTIGPEDLERLGSSAEERGFYWHAGWLWTKAIRAGSILSADYLVRLVGRTSPGDIDEVTRWVVEQGILHSPILAAEVLKVLQDLNSPTTIGFVLDQRPAEFTNIENAWAVAELIQTLHTVGDEAAARELAARAASGSSIDLAYDVAALIDAMYKIGARSALDELLMRSPERYIRLDEKSSVERLLETLMNVGARPAAVSLALRVAKSAPGTFISSAKSIWGLCGRQVAEEFINRVADQIQYADIGAITELADELETLGMRRTLARLLERVPVDHVEFKDVGSVVSLMRHLLAHGGNATATRIANRAATHAPLEDLTSLDELGRIILVLCGQPTAKEFAARIVKFADVQDTQEITAALDVLDALDASEFALQLLERTRVDQIKLGSAHASSTLLKALRKARARTFAERLAARAAAEAPLDDLSHIGELAGEVLVLCGLPVTRELFARIAAKARIENPSDAAMIIEMLSTFGADELIAELLERNPADQIELENPYSVRDLLQAAKKAGASTFTERLAVRAAAQAPVEDPGSLDGLAEEIFMIAGPTAARELCTRVMTQAPLNDASTAATLLNVFNVLREDKLINELLKRNPANQIELDSINSVSNLLKATRRAGASAFAKTLASRAAAQIPLKDANYGQLDDFAEEIALNCGASGAKRLGARVAEEVELASVAAAALVIKTLHDIGADEAISRLLARCPVEQLKLNDTNSITYLISELRRAGATRAITALSARAAEKVEITDVQAIINLVGAMRDAGALQESLSLMRRASKIAAERGDNYSRITENFKVVESADLHTATSILMYGPAPDKQEPRPWAWRDLVEQEQGTQLD